MKRSNFIKPTLLFLTCIALWSCSHADIIQESTDDLPPLQTDVKYNPEVQNIMFNNCITCHGGPSPSARSGFDNLSKCKSFGREW